MAKQKIVVTGGSGKAGRACVRELLEHGYDVLNVDLAPPAPAPSTDAANCPFVRADLTDFGQTLDVLSGVDERVRGDVEAIVHLAAIPAPGLATNAVTFQTNMMSTYNVFEAARRMGIRNVVWASSETVLGLPFDTPPDYAPIDEEACRPESAYSLSKMLGEEMAEHFCRWEPAMKITGLRLSNVMEPPDYARFPSFDADARLRKWNLWGYIDARDAAAAMRKALEAKITGAHVFIIANADTVMQRPSSELMAEVFPSVRMSRPVAGNETLLSIEKARRVLGWEPKHSWRGGGG
ncbi:MAG: hypothetical protein QOE14_396 [Humisphaera sp.]|nr:hypothetical protein [Humisphaera sp.]